MYYYKYLLYIIYCFLFTYTVNFFILVPHVYVRMTECVNYGYSM